MTDPASRPSPRDSSRPAAEAARATIARAVVAAAAVVLAFSLLLAFQELSALALASMTVATLATIGALWLDRDDAAPARAPAGRWWTLGILWVAIAASFAFDALVIPGEYT